MGVDKGELGVALKRKKSTHSKKKKSKVMNKTEEDLSQQQSTNKLKVLIEKQNENESVCNTDKQKLSGDSKYFKARENLPIFSAQEKLVEHFKKHNTCILVGETGSGKTTQLTQYLLSSGIAGSKIIGCTQPRRVAAITVAQRVAKEQGAVLGKEVGYTVRFQDCTSNKTKIKYLTDGMLLREAIADPLLKKYGIIILDEAHERTLHTDVLFSIVKDVQSKRKDFKVIVMSATLDASKFSSYFNDCSVLYVAGRQFPVELLYCCKPEVDFVDATVVTALQIHLGNAPGDILCFLTGQDDIESAQELLQDKAKHLPESAMQLQIVPIYAALSSEEQMKVFEPAALNSRKIILATNIAETSLTINGIRHVVDCGMVKMRTFNAKSGIERLEVQAVSKAQARQRTGRAGRESSGTCYRLYEEKTFHSLENVTQPEIVRCSLASVVLQLLALGVTDITKFDFMDKPDISSLKEAMYMLLKLGALDNKGKISEHGKCLARFPVEPSLAKVLVSSCKFGCLEEILSIVSLVSVPNIFFTPYNKRDEVLEQKRKFIAYEGDHITLLNVYRQYQSQRGDPKWCRENFVNSKAMKTVVDTRKQIRDLCIRLNLSIESCGTETIPIRKSLVSGFFMNVASLQEDNTYKTLNSNKTVYVHPSSVLMGRKVKYILFNEIVKTKRPFMRTISSIEASWASDASPNTFE